MKRAAGLVVVVVSIAGALAYLRDPAWLARQESGLRAWETAADGTRFRWTSGHASFFVPSSWSLVEVPVRATFPSPTDWPIVVTISIDDRPANRIRLEEDSWHRAVLRLPARGNRRVRRIDIRLDRMRDERRGVQLGEVSGR